MPQLGYRYFIYVIEYPDLLQNWRAAVNLTMNTVILHLQFNLYVLKKKIYIYNKVDEMDVKYGTAKSISVIGQMHIKCVICY